MDDGMAATRSLRDSRRGANAPRGAPLWCTSTANRVLFLPGFHGFWPVAAQQAAQGAVGQHLAVGLAARAVVDLVLGVADALHQSLAGRAGLQVATVHGHIGAKRGDLLGEGITRL